MGAKNIHERFRAGEVQKSNAARRNERSAVQSRGLPLRTLSWTSFPERGLPAPEERRHILESASLVLAQALALRAKLDAAESRLNWSAPVTYRPPSI
jgi:hypothetical protein